MNDLKNVTQVVKEILKTCERARNSDSILYLKVLQLYAEKSGKVLHQISVPYFLLHMDDLGFPAFETVRRTRQKIQATYPDLAASKKVEEYRTENEKTFKAYAVGSIE